MNAKYVASKCKCLAKATSQVLYHYFGIRFLVTYFLSVQVYNQQSLNNFQVLETCMKNCGKRFHSEVGKFRFLNELIKVVSPKVIIMLLLPSFPFGSHVSYLYNSDLMSLLVK